MKLSSLISEFKTDKHGRIIINDPELLKFVNGAAGAMALPGSDTACHDNAACGNAECGNAGCRG